MCGEWGWGKGRRKREFGHQATAVLQCTVVVILDVGNRTVDEGAGYQISLPGGSAGKESVCNAGDLGLIRGLGRSPREGNGYPLQYSGLENSMDYTVHGVAKSQA